MSALDWLVRTELGHLLLFQVMLLAIFASNAVLLRRARRHAPPRDWPMVSVLLPARNEEASIAACVRSLADQHYAPFEVLVLDDRSDDATPAVLAALAARHPVVRVLTNDAPAGGLSGKNGACDELARHARGDLLFFTDADTVHAPETLRGLVTALCGEGADMLTGFPRQALGTWGERLLVPFFAWASLCFTPLVLAYRLPWPALSTAVGQAMLFRRAAYQVVGGHAALGDAVNDDLLLACAVKSAGLRWRLVRVADLIACRMYRGGWHAVEGFTKNYFAVFGSRVVPTVLAFGWLVHMAWTPVLGLARWALGLAAPEPAGLLACLGVGLLAWAAPYGELRVPVGLAVLYPLTVLGSAVVALRSLVLAVTGRLTWKGRALPRARWRWL
jgi:chlorobactene glucosyltransferase